MFGKKKETGLSVQHYEGISEFATDYPCRLELTDDSLIVKRLKPETTVILERNRIKSISAMDEENFMIKYHNEKSSSAKAFKKYFLIITYDKGHLAFWGTAKEYGTFVKMQYGQTDAPTHLSL